MPLLRSIVHLSSMSVVSWANWRVVCCLYTFPCCAFCLRSHFTVLQAGGRGDSEGITTRVGDGDGTPKSMKVLHNGRIGQLEFFGHLQLNLNTDNN